MTHSPCARVPLPEPTPSRREEVPAAVGEPEAPPAGAPAEAILALQRSAGNQSVARLLDPVGAQSRWPWGYGPWPERDPYLTPPDPPEQIEYETLAPIRHYFEKQSYEGYLEIRELLLAKFGLEQDGPQAAVQRALAYYPEGDAAAAAPARQALAAFVFPTEEEDQSRLWDEELVESTVDVLAAMGRIFEDTFDPKDPDKRVGPISAFPSDAQLALHGFMSVPPELVAVLSGDKMGNLKWLGSTAGEIKDYMHFDLRQRPVFY